MNYSTAIFLISDVARAVLVSYETPAQGHEAETTMFKTLDPDIKIDDYVVVATDTRHHMTVCKVIETDIDVDFDMSSEVKWIIGVVNTADADEIKRQEDDAILKIKSAEKRRKRDELRDALINDAGADLKALPIYSVAAKVTK